MELVKVFGDITEMKVDAIVLPANGRLFEGSGTSSAIYKAAGREELRVACAEFTKNFKTIKEGTCIRTSSFKLKDKTGVQHIFHAVVPKWQGGNKEEDKILFNTYLRVLEAADIYGCESIAFPLLGSGNNGFDRKYALDIAEQSVAMYNAKTLKEVCLVIYKQSDIVDEKSVSVQKEFSRCKDIAESYVLEATQRLNNYFEDPKHQKELFDLAEHGITILKNMYKNSVEDKKNDPED